MLQHDRFLNFGRNHYNNWQIKEYIYSDLEETKYVIIISSHELIF